MATFAAFTDGAEVIQRTVAIETVREYSASQVNSIFEIDRCIIWIKDNHFSRVALQFPDELLSNAATIVSILTSKTSAKVFILADTSYGNCCVDEVTAEHNSADSIIHFGQTCLSPTHRLPVLFVFTQLVIDVEHCSRELASLVPEPNESLIIVYDVRYHYAIDEIMLLLKARNFQPIVPELLNSRTELTKCKQLELNTKDLVEIRKFGRKIIIRKDKSLADYSVLYIGSEGPSLINWMMNLNKCKFFTYNPVTRTAKRETLDINRMLMKRYYMIERAKDAQIIGILAGTLGVTDHITIMNQLKQMIRAAGKKSYTFVVGKLNVAKLANFAEIDIFVLVACPENTLIDSSEFYRPIITPFELEVACNQAREWTGDYYTDFQELLPGAAGHVEISNHPSEISDISLITGSVRTLGVKEESIATSNEISERDHVLTVANTAGEFLSTRIWKGLEENLGKTAVTKAVEGSKGIAASYTNEPT